ncbi:Mating-type protein [Yarrowia sp. B02]|nr:Mating-type protein [Yarrowia sp. B02]
MPSRTPTDIWRCQRLILASRKGETTCHAIREKSIGVASSAKWFDEMSAWASRLPEAGNYESTALWAFLEGVPAEYRAKFDDLTRHYITYIQQLVPIRFNEWMVGKAIFGTDWTDEYDLAKGVAAELLDDFLEVATNLDRDIEEKSQDIAARARAALEVKAKIEKGADVLQCLDPNGDILPKKVRNRLSNDVAAYLECLFKICSHPTRTERRLIGEHCGISLHQVTQWFTNRRFREPKTDSSDESTMFIPSPMTSPESMDDCVYPDSPEM